MGLSETVRSSVPQVESILTQRIGTDTIPNDRDQRALRSQTSLRPSVVRDAFRQRHHRRDDAPLLLRPLPSTLVPSLPFLYPRADAVFLIFPRFFLRTAFVLFICWSNTIDRYPLCTAISREEKTQQRESARTIQIRKLDCIACLPSSPTRFASLPSQHSRSRTARMAAQIQRTIHDHASPPSPAHLPPSD